MRSARVATRLLDIRHRRGRCSHASMLGRHPCAHMRQEEADHLPAGVGSARVRVGAVDTAAGPGMARAVKDPLLKDLPAGVVELDLASVGHAAWRLAVRHRLGQHRILRCLGDDVVAVARVDGPVGIAMENDGWHYPSFTPLAYRSAPTHGSEG